MLLSMANIEQELDPTKVRSGLFAIMTAMLEDAHDAAVKGQSSQSSVDDIDEQITDIRSILDEVKVQLDAAELIIEL